MTLTRFLTASTHNHDAMRLCHGCVAQPDRWRAGGRGGGELGDIDDSPHTKGFSAYLSVRLASCTP